MDGNYPNGDLVLDRNGSLYGVTLSGGKDPCAQNLQTCGIVYQLNPPSGTGKTWTENILHIFSYADGYQPIGPVVLGPGGAIYGGTSGGGPYGLGEVFQLRPPSTPGGKWSLVKLYVITPQSGFSDVAGPLTFHGGALFGATAGGLQVSGQVFAITP
jgi:hypothetical protein